MSCLPAQGGTGKQLNTSSDEPDDPIERVGPPQNAALDSLSEELGEDAATRFVDHYLALLDCRITGIGQSIEQGTIEPGITLLLTLETSSHMVGASDLCLRATALRLALAGSLPDTSARYRALVRAAASTRKSLTSG